MRPVEHLQHWQSFSEFIKRCSDQELLQEILKDLIPMQMGKKSQQISCRPVKKNFRRSLMRELNLMETEMRML